MKSPSIENRPQVVLDTSALIELLGNTARGKKVEQKIGARMISLPTMVVSEACALAAKRGENAELLLRLLLSEMYVVHLDSAVAYNASQLYVLARKKRTKFSLTDAIVVMTADSIKAPVLTCDNDFAGMKNVTVIQ